MGALFELTVWESLGSVLFTLYDQTTPTENDIHLAFNPYHDELVNLNDMWSGEDIDKLLEGGFTDDKDDDEHDYDKDLGAAMSILDYLSF